MPLYALHLGDQWVEIRQAKSPPILNTTRVVREVKVPPGLAELVGVRSPHKIEIKNFSFVGGKPLFTISKLVLASAHRKILGAGNYLPPITAAKHIELPYSTKTLRAMLDKMQAIYYA